MATKKLQILDSILKQSDWNQTDETQNDYIKNKPDLANVATSGSWNDLSDKPFGEISGEIITLNETYIPDTIQRVGDDLIFNSSTEGSTKKFRLTIDDSGVLTATEMVE